ncbi:uncharacterized protein K02A2.6-like [Liolophura sinensis]|uniref:uncharacterized protein K02A2.6-like n=1 Tax=Liolophura sinensis TaxID=3198878 RepID=UPI00315875F2
MLQPPAVVPYFNLRDELTNEDGLILKGQQIVIPQSLRADMLHRIHSSHVGIEGCCRRARDCVYWPGMSAAVKDFIEKCDICRSYGSKQPKETLHPHVIPDRPWAKVGSDVFTFDGNDYLVTVDYYSNFWELDYLEKTTSSTIICKLKAQFARHGIPEIFISDNASYHTSGEFHKFSRKRPLQVSHRVMLKPRVSHFSSKFRHQRKRQEMYYNRGTRDLPMLRKGDVVQIQPQGQVTYNYKLKLDRRGEPVNFH